MKRLITFAATLALLAGCGPSGGGSLGPGPTGAGSPATTGSPPAGSPPATDPPGQATPPGNQTGATITIQTWFTRANRIVATQRVRPATAATSRLALTELKAGPTAQEAGLGVGNAIAQDITFEIGNIQDGTAVVSFSAGFFGGGGDVARLRQAQVVYTLTQFPTVSRVQFVLNGNNHGHWLARADLQDLLPPILVLSPVIGQRVGNAVTVSGSADVREATVNLRVLAEDGKPMLTKFTTATCGSGCRGTFSISAALALPCKEAGRDTPITIEVYEVSGEDGSRVNVVRVPVTVAVC